MLMDVVVRRKMDDNLERLTKKLTRDLLEQANAALVTIEDCYEALDVWIGHEPTTFTNIQEAYRHQLYKYNPDKPGLTVEAIEYKTLMKEKVKQAYLRICEALQKDPADGLTETEESLIAERDELLKGWTEHWCGTPSLSIQQEYEERIEAIKEKGNAI